MAVKRVAVIGAGAAGLSSARHLVADPAHFDCTVFEQTGSVGGTWVYTDRVGKDEFGLPVHSSMYKSLRTNLPKEVMGFPDYPIPEQERSYLPAKDILQFLNDYADHFHVRERVRFYHHVLSVAPKPAGGWAVRARDLRTQEDKEEHFDAVMVCNGHYSKPFVPALPGAEAFLGASLHSHDYRTPDAFKDKHVVVIGAGPSGMDLCLEVALSGAASVVLSHHWPEPITTRFPDNVRQAGDVVKVSERSVQFADGSTGPADVLFYCTGYLYSFPFLSEECRVRVEDNHVQPLYKHLVHIDHPTMALVGLPFYVCANSLFDLQARVFLRTLKGEVVLPGREEMLADTQHEMQRRRALGMKNRQAHMMGPMQGDYYSELAALGNLESLPAVLTKLHNESSQRFLEDLVSYREDVYKIIDQDNYIKAN